MVTVISDSHKAHSDILQDPAVCPPSVMETAWVFPQHDMVILSKPSSRECPLGAPISCPQMGTERGGSSSLWESPSDGFLCWVSSAV